MVNRRPTECEVCRGREFGDFSDECRYFAETATDGELEAARRDWKPSQTPQAWLGPTGHESEDAA